VSPRRNNRRPDSEGGLDDELARRGFAREQTSTDGSWLVRTISPDAAAKTYRCPGCDHEIRPGVAHVVVWPADERGDLADRRHWHAACWRAHDRRPPRRL
jgi:hypothetical protein